MAKVNVDEYEELFKKYRGMMRTKQLQEEGIYYRQIQKLIEQGCVQKVRYGYYLWEYKAASGDEVIVSQLFPDAVLCMDTALHYYGYNDHNPVCWHLAVSKDAGKSRFRITYPSVKPYYMEPKLLEIGVTSGEIDGSEVRIYDKERIICDCLRYRNKMDREIFTKAIRSYVRDSDKNIPRLMEYADALHVKKIAKDLIGVWF